MRDYDRQTKPSLLTTVQSLISVLRRRTNHCRTPLCFLVNELPHKERGAPMALSLESSITQKCCPYGVFATVGRQTDKPPSPRAWLFNDGFGPCRGTVGFAWCRSERRAFGLPPLSQCPSCYMESMKTNKSTRCESIV